MPHFISVTLRSEENTRLTMHIKAVGASVAELPGQSCSMGCVVSPFHRN